MTLRTGLTNGAARTDAARGNLQVVLGAKAFYPVYSGPGVRFQRYARGLRERGVDLSIVTRAVTDEALSRDGSMAGVESQSTPVWPLDEIVDGLPIHRLPAIDPPRGAGRLFREIAGHVIGRSPRPRVVQLLDLDLSAAFPLRRLRRNGVRSVFTHTLLGDLSDAYWKRALQRIHRRLPLELVDRVVVSSRSMKNQIEALGPRTPIEVIPNGVDLTRFRPPCDDDERLALRTKLGLRPDWTIVLAVGPVIPRKGADSIIEAFASLASRNPAARLVMVGPRHDLARPALSAFRESIERTLREQSANDAVLFTGAVDNVEDYLRCADILVFPSRREGMPNVPAEAMAAGLPVVMTPFIGLPQEFGTPGREYILSDWAPSRLAADLEPLLHSPNQRRELGQAGRRHVESNLALDRSLDAYAALYRRLAPSAA